MDNTKVCTKCRRDLPVTEYHFRADKDRPDRRHTECRKCRCRRNYENRRGKRAALKIKAIVYKGRKCLDCGYIGHPAAFDFHHRDPTTKRFNWPKMSYRDWSIIKTELDKCDMLCAICHRIRHWKEDSENCNGVSAAVHEYIADPLFIENVQAMFEHEGPGSWSED